MKMFFSTPDIPGISDLQDILTNKGVLNRKRVKSPSCK